MDREEATCLVERYGTMVYRLAYARTGSREDAEDITQETFLKLVRATRFLGGGTLQGLAAAGGSQLCGRSAPISLAQACGFSGGGGRENRTGMGAWGHG